MKKGNEGGGEGEGGEGVEDERARGGRTHVLPAASLLHDAQLLALGEDGLGQVAVTRDASDLRVVLELLLQLLIVVHRCSLPGGHLGGGGDIVAVKNKT